MRLKVFPPAHGDVALAAVIVAVNALYKNQQIGVGIQDRRCCAFRRLFPVICRARGASTARAPTHDAIWLVVDINAHKVREVGITTRHQCQIAPPVVRGISLIVVDEVVLGRVS